MEALNVTITLVISVTKRNVRRTLINKIMLINSWSNGCLQMNVLNFIWKWNQQLN